MIHQFNIKWLFPIKDWNGFVPTDEHPGAFAAIRKHDIHTGVDLYVPEPCKVYAVERGVVIKIEDYTGPKADSPWWLPTESILIEGASGVVCYGEVAPENIVVGDLIEADQAIATIAPVLPKGKKRPDILGHSRFMLHFELYKHGTRNTVWWRLNEEKPSNLLNPTELLLAALKSPIIKCL